MALRPRGRYSLYSSGVTDQNYLRGVQAADADGRLSFTSIFPAAYSGRWPHIHFEVFEDLATATSGGSPIVTSQLALPEDACAEVYATAGYEQSVSNLAGTSLDARHGLQRRLRGPAGRRDRLRERRDDRRPHRRRVTTATWTAPQ